MIDIEALLAPVSPETPSGPDLRDHADFRALVAAAAGKPEQQFGTTVTPAVEPDWLDVSRRSTGLLKRSKDLRVAALLARATARNDHIEGISAGLILIKELLSRYWDTLHPALENEPGDEATMRLNALFALGDPATFLSDVRNACLVGPGPHGTVPIRDVLAAEGKLRATSATLTGAQIRGMVQAAATATPLQLEAAAKSLEAVQAIESFLGEKDGLGTGLNLVPLREMLKTVVEFAKKTVKPETEAASVSPAAASVSQGGAPNAASPGSIASRDDAVKVLENVCRFLEQSEPANPAPLLIRRAQRLMTKNFVEIIADLVPDRLDQIRNFAGVEAKPK